MVVVSEDTEGISRVDIGTAAVGAGHTQRVIGHALAGQHAQNVMIGRDQKVGGVRKGRIIGEPRRFAMAVRADQWRAGDAFIKRLRLGADGRFRRKEPFWM